MTKPEQKETKPSDLERSKSADDINLTPPKSIPLTKSHSRQEFLDDYEYPCISLVSQQEKIAKLEKEI
ncbi:MAG: hypothetical protein MRERC_1c172 [Mycoplasmataceae bacterium RC_NB112A]|nr:MAG: hypothetical protein MRERC_1c172 [Mycoplasmataceae bacterium RC_NB112A]